jgi:predicted  nucleic acid-binding Zn-ribbon protein
MSTEPVSSNIAVVAEGESTLFDSLARLVPEELQTAYYRVLAHTRKLSPDDEMLRILEAMGILALLTRHTPMEIAEERERFQEMLDLHRQYSDEAQQKMLGYVYELEKRIARLPEKIEAGLDAQKIARLLSESLRQNFLESGLPAAARCLQGTSAAMTRAQKELSAALDNLSDSNGGVIAQVESANNRLTQSLEKRTNTLDELLHKLNTHVLYVWIPVISTAALVIGLAIGMRIEGCMGSVPAAATSPTAVRALPTPEPQGDSGPVESPKQRSHSRGKVNSGAVHEQ